MKPRGLLCAIASPLLLSACGGASGPAQGTETAGTDAGSASTTSATGDSATSTGEPTTSSATTTSDTGDDRLRLDHVQVKGTHNSYHIAPDNPLDASHAYTHVPLDQQLQDQGVRAFELDVHLEDDGYHVYHIGLIDDQTTCDMLTDCLDTIKGWSDANPTHLPIMVWFEIKDDTGGMAIDDLQPIDDVLTATFSSEQLLTPDDVQADFASPRARIEADGWPALDDVRGSVMFIVLSTDEAGGYTSNFTTLAGKSMFVRANPEHYDLGWAVVTKINNPAADAEIAAAHAANLLIASNTCGADQSDADCTAELEAGMANGVHMLKDDFPAPVPQRRYWLDFPDGNPARCNAVTAPPTCTAQALEDLP